MKNLKSYMGLSLFMALALAGCQDDFDNPELVAPVATIEANTSIYDFKTQYWNFDDPEYLDNVQESEDHLNYIAKVGVKENGENIIIKGRVVSSDRTGNIYKNLVIQDETAALTISVDKTGMYNIYRIGQEVVLDVTGLFIGKYNGLEQLGYPDFTEQYGWQASFMPYAMFEQNLQLNGFPEPEKVDTIVTTIADVNSITDMPRWQSRLVRLNNVRFEDGDGALCYTDGSEISSNRTLYDENGNSLTVRNSGYASFWSDKLPAGYGDVVGILSYYYSTSSSGWQLMLNSADDCMNFGNPTINPGTEKNPYTVPQAIEKEQEGAVTSGWVTGYIVGAVAHGVSVIASNDDIEWGAPATLPNTVVLAPTADVKEISQCLVIALPQGSKLREYGNLVDNPENIGKQMWVFGTLEKYMETWGITKAPGTTSDFRIEGVNPLAVTSINETFEGVTGVNALTGWTSLVVAGDKDWYFTEYDSNTYAACTAYKGTDSGNGYDSWLITPPLKVDEMTSKVLSFESQAAYKGSPDLEVYVMTTNDPATATLTRLNCTLATAPSSGYSGFEPSGNISLEDYTGIIYIGFRYTATTASSSMTWCIDNVKAGVGASSGNTGTDTPQFGLVSSITSGKKYVIYANDKIATTLAGSYGYLPTVDATAQDGYITTETANAFTIKAVSGGYTIQDAQNRYIYMTGTYNSFNTDASMPASGAVWQIEPQSNGTMKILNVEMNKYIQFDTQYGNFGSYSDARGDMPYLYEEGAIASETPDEPENPDTPDVPTPGNVADFNTFNGGEPKSSYGTYTTTAGWVATNCAIQSGTTGNDSNPKFGFIGDESVFAVCLNGKTSAPGSLVSPTLAGGIKTLSFNYGFAFKDTACTFTINIKQNGQVVKSVTYKVPETTQKTTYDYLAEFNVEGDFVIEIVNDCESAQDKNIDRISIWNLTWTN